MFGTVSKWIGVYNIWYYGVFMALNGKLAYCMPNLSILPIVAVLTFLILSVVIQACSTKWYSVVCSDLWSHRLLVAWSRDIKQQKLFFFSKVPELKTICVPTLYIQPNFIMPFWVQVRYTQQCSKLRKFGGHNFTTREEFQPQSKIVATFN